VIRVEFEHVVPVICCDFSTDADEHRLVAWLERRPELADLVQRALELVEDRLGRRPTGGQMRPEDAEEYTQALRQVVAGGWRQIALGRRLGVPEALGLTTEAWVNERLGGYVRLHAPERRDAVAVLTAEGMSNVAIGEVLGVDERTVRRDSANAEQPAERPASSAAPDNGASANAEAEATEPAATNEAKDDVSGNPEPNPHAVAIDVTLSIADAVRYLDRPLADAERVAEMFSPAAAGISREDWTPARFERAGQFLGALTDALREAMT
jgi:hypothetical protein